MEGLITAVGVAIFGGAASVIRLGLSRWSGWLPWGILFANVSASLLIGVELVGAQQASPLIVAGVCGGLSTLSTFAAQTVDLARAGLWLRAIINLVANVGLSTAAALTPLAFGAALLN